MKLKSLFCSYQPRGKIDIKLRNKIFKPMLNLIGCLNYIRENQGLPNQYRLYGHKYSKEISALIGNVVRPLE